MTPLAAAIPPILVLLTGCATQLAPSGDVLRLPVQTMVAEQSIASLRDGRTHEASIELNKALALFPDDANLHFLNGLAYSQMDRAGGRSVLELAETGYRLALEFDPGHWLAAWHLGLIQLAQRRHQEARNALALAARAQPLNPDIQLALAGSAYLSSDAPVALLAAEKTLALRPADTQALRIAAMSSAALDMSSDTKRYLIRLRDARPEDGAMTSIRTDRWQQLYAQAETAETDTNPRASSRRSGAWAGQLQLANPTSDREVETPPAPPAILEQGPIAPRWSDCQQNVFATSSGGGDSSGNDGTERLAALPSPCKGVPLPRMAVVDVTLIRTQEMTKYGQGVNLLDGLKVVLSGERSYNSDNIPKRSVTRSIGLPSAGIPYSLNIFNAGDTTADVIARPSLLALDRTPATFFSGSTVSVAISGQYGGNLNDKAIGVSLSVTPTFIDDERLLLAVKGVRSFIEPAQFAGFDQSVTASNNTVSTNVIMRFGETLILSGLREREHTRNKDGVPLLRDIPALQYLFSQQSQGDFAHHVLILITPRRPSNVSETEQIASAYIRSPGFQAEPDDIAQEAISALRPRRPNLEAIMAKIHLSRYRHEFRSGDLSRRRFAPQPSLERVLQDVQQLLYY